MPGGVGLRREHAVQASGRHALDGDVVQDGGGVDDGGDPVTGEECRQPGPVGHVAGGDGDARALGLQLGAQPGRAGRVGAAPGDQQQVLYAVPLDQPPGDQRAQPTGAAGDEDGARAQPGTGFLPWSRDGPAGQAGNQDHAVAGHELRLARRHRGRGRTPGGEPLFHVEQDESPRMLGLRGAHQPPERATRRRTARPRVTNTSRDPENRSSPTQAWMRLSAWFMPSCAL